MKVYIELLFLDNLVMNLIILYFSGRLANIKIQWFRLIGGAAIGGAYACLMFTLQGILFLIPLRVLTSFAICAVAFYKRKQIQAYAKSVILFYVVTFVAGGAAFAFLNLAAKNYMVKGGIIVGGTEIRIVLGGLLTAILILALFKRLNMLTLQKAVLYDLSIDFMGKKMICRAFMDTGNALKEPLSGLPVIIVESESLKGILPERMLRMLNGVCADDCKNESWFNRVRVVPCKGAANMKSVLFGFKPDHVYVKQKGVRRELLAIVGITNDMLHETGMYHALLGPQVMA
jgi:stage II sporulation protein GA (sporulation sigma-E factor processing peptidase)